MNPFLGSSGTDFTKPTPVFISMHVGVPVKLKMQDDSYRFLWSGRNLLAHLLCCLLMVSLPVLAQGSQCTGKAIQTNHISAIHNIIDPLSPDFCPPLGDHVDYGVTFNPPVSGGDLQDPFTNHLDPDLNMKRYRQGAGKPSDQRNIYDMGVDPATLSPEALDLDIFPTFEISAELSLIPSLSYAPNHVLSRMGRLNYGPPKQWQNHYGELVVMIGPTEPNRAPVGAPDPGGVTPPPPARDDQRLPVPSELQVFFINAAGQQVNFYPDPELVDAQNKPIASNGQVARWFSEDGSYRLIDQNTTGAFQFELHTSGGLKMAFADYAYHLDPEQEAVTRHFRVTKITDRHDNYVAIGYRDDLQANGGEPNYSGDPVLQPYKVSGHRNGGGPNTLLQEITYKYDQRNRLVELELPAYEGDTQAFTFYYLDSGAIQNFPLANPAQVTNRLMLNNVYSHTLNASNGHVSLPPLKTLVDGYLHLGSPGWSDGLFLNFDSLDFAPEIGVDFEEIFTSGGYTGEFKSAPHPFHVASGSHTALLVPQGKARQIKSNMAIEPDAIHYRYKIHEDQYPSGVDQTSTPDFVDVNTVQSGFTASGPATISVLPRLKQGDLLTWVTGNTVGVNTLDLQGANPTHLNNGTYQYPITGNDTPPSSGLYFIRKDQRDRIAEIAYPEVPNSSRKRLLFKYAENSRNHAEIADILTYDEPSTGSPRLLSRTTYTYEQVLVQTAAEDLAPMLSSPLAENDWRNCARTDVPLDPAGDHKVSYGVNRLNRHELIDMLRHKRVRTYEPGLVKNDTWIPFDNYRDLETFYGGAWRFAMLGFGNFNEQNPSDPNAPDTAKTCDVMEWGVAQKPFDFTWQINPDGSAQIFDLSADGVGLDPVLAYANTGVRVFKTYQFDTAFKKDFSDGLFDHFLGSTAKPYTPYYQYLPRYKVLQSHCTTDCTISDLELYPQLDSSRLVPTMANLFGFGKTKAYAASVELFEPIPMYGYSLLTDIHPDQLRKKITLGSLHGSIHQTGEQTPDRFYYRVSAIHDIHHIAAGDTQCEVSLIDTFLRGQLTSQVKTEDATYDITETQTGEVSYSYDVDWTYGGNLGSSSCFQFIHDRQKNHRLRPHSQIQLRNLDGFSWNATKNILDLETNNSNQSPWVVEATRFSNGGYLGRGSADAADGGANTSTLTGTTFPSDVQVGDVFTHNYKIYEITEHTGTTYTAQPALEPGVVSDLQFYRFYNPEAPLTHPYLGYDIFGNNAFKATYKRGELFFSHEQDKAQGKDHGLVPDFFLPSAIPFALNLNDSTDPQNQDDKDALGQPGEWEFFGRVTRRFDTGKLALYANTSGNGLTPYGTWKHGMLSDQIFDYSSSTAYRWLPTNTVSYYLPVEIENAELADLNLSTLQALAPENHAEDLRTTYRYYSPGGVAYAFTQSNPMSHGRVSLEWSGKSEHPQNPAAHHFTATRYEYDTEGWLLTKDVAIIDANTDKGLYGTRTNYTHDDALGLVKETRTEIFQNPTWNSTGGAANLRLDFSGTGQQRGRTETDYDLIGRPIRTQSFDAADQAMGPIVHTSYPSQTQMVTIHQDPLDPNPVHQQSEAMIFTGGAGQTLSQIRRRGSESLAYATYTAYDALGRVAAVSAEREFPNTIDLTTLAVGDATAEGYTESRYNGRGEAFGTVLFAYEEGDPGSFSHKAIQSHWSLEKQDLTTGNTSTWQLQQVPGETVPQNSSPKFLNLKVLEQNQDGLLESVADYRKPYEETLWTEISDVDLATAAGSLGDAGMKQLSQAIYTYDRLGHVTNAKVGTEIVQDRFFLFDQRNRLREETHPEMPGIKVTYSDFDTFDNPLTVLHKQGSSVLRDWRSTYDIAGNLLESRSRKNVSTPLSTLTTTYIYNDSVAGTPPAFPDRVRAVRHEDDQGRVFVYRHDYDAQRGDLTGRSFYHNQPLFPGHANNTSLTTLAGISEPDSEIHADYLYDAMGRLLSLTYPAKVTGAATETKLDFFYKSNGFLDRVEDVAFSPKKLVLMDQITFGVGDQLTDVNFARPSYGNEHHLKKTYDSLNRIQTWENEWRAGLGSRKHLRTYGYDLSGRIHQIELADNTEQGAYQFAYEGLGQISQATHRDLGSTSTTTWDYTYDGVGLGNLTSFKENLTEKLGGSSVIDLATNRIAGSDNYTQLGELKKLTDANQTEFAMAYDAMGRMDQLSIPGNNALNAAYAYDHAGMRVLTKNEGSQPGLDQSQTLYFYDADGMVLCEWVSEKHSNGTWSNARWDRSYVYLDGQSSLTYEYDSNDTGQGGPVVPTGPAITSPQLISTAIFQWQDVGSGTYELEIQDAKGQTVAVLGNLDGTQWHEPYLKYGKYQVRARLSEQAWGAWSTVYYMDAGSQETVGKYALNGATQDQSHYENSLTLQGQTHYIAGKQGDGAFLSSGESITIDKPHQLLSGSQAAVSFWMKPLVDNASEDVGPDRDLWRLGDLRLTVNKHGQMKVTYPGLVSVQPNVLASGTTWQHVTILYGNGVLQVYLDNVLRFDLTGAPTAQISAEDMIWGHASSNQGAATGIDDIRCFNKTLTLTDINDLFSASN